MGRRINPVITCFMILVTLVTIGFSSLESYAYSEVINGKTYVMATDSDFVKVGDNFLYRGFGDYIIIPDVIQGEPVTSYREMFSEYTGSDTSRIKGVKSTNPNVTDTSRMFRGYQSLTLELYLDTSGVVNASQMFEGCRALVLDLSELNTSAMEDMSFMFCGSEAGILVLDAMDTSNVVTMRSMFNDSWALKLDLSSFNTVKVRDMNNIFCGSFATEIILESFDTRNVNDMGGMFSNSAVKVIDLNNINTQSLTYAENMFSGAKVEELDFTGFNTSGLNSLYGMFRGCMAKELILTSFDTSNVTNTGEMFNGAAAKVIDMSSFDMRKVTYAGGMFCAAEAEVIDMSSFDTQSLLNTDYMFCGALALELDLTHLNTSKVKSAVAMFNGAQAKELDLTPLDTSSMENMDYFLYGAQAEKVILTGFDTSNVVSAKGMFDATRVSELNLVSFDTTNMADTDNMFRLSSATVGYAGTQEDADRLNATSNKPSYLNFIVKTIHFEIEESTEWKKSHSTEMAMEAVPSIFYVTSAGYQWTDSLQVPEDGAWTSWASGDTTSISGKTGEYYLHMMGTHNDGWTVYDTSKKFLLDNKEPSIQIIPDTTEPTTEDIWIEVVAVDSHSGMDNLEYRIDNGTWREYVQPFKILRNCVIHVRADDNVGNHGEKSLVVDNIVQTEQDKPGAPEATSIGINSVVLTSDSGTMVQLLSKSGIQIGEPKPSGSTFTGLTEGETYMAYAYYRATDDLPESEKSDITTFKTVQRVPEDDTIDIVRPYVNAYTDGQDILDGDMPSDYSRFLDGRVQAISVGVNGRETLLLNGQSQELHITNIPSDADEYRFGERDGSKLSWGDWEKFPQEALDSGVLKKNIGYRQQGQYMTTFQYKSTLGILSRARQIETIVDFEAPDGRIVKEMPQQTASSGDSISIRLDVGDKLSSTCFIKLDGTWRIIDTDFFEYKLGREKGLQAIEILISDIAGNKRSLTDSIWRL